MTLTQWRSHNATILSDFNLTGSEDLGVAHISLAALHTLGPEDLEPWIVDA